MYQKGKWTQPLKNTQIYQNEQTQIDARGRFYSQNKQTLTRSTKSPNLDDHHKTSFISQKDVYKSRRTQQEAKYGKE